MNELDTKKGFTMEWIEFGGDMNASLALCGQVAGRIDSVRPVKEIIEEVAADFFEVLDRTASRYLADAPAGNQ